VAAALATTSPAYAINLNVSASDVDRVLAIARERDRERAPFHAPYITAIDSEFVERIEVVTELRRILLLAEERIRTGDRGFAYSSRLAMEAARPWKQRVSVIARVRLHPQNNYVTVPDFEVDLDGADAAKAAIGVLKDPVYGFVSDPNAPAPILGAVVEGVFDAAVVGQTQRTVTIKLGGKVLSATRVNFAALE
jgi:hypothetical protein